jgi:flagellar M-ring protein FliF
MKPILDGLQALGAGRLLALGAVGIGMLVMIGLLALHGGAPSRMSLLYADLDMREASQIADALDRAHIAHEEPGQGDRVLVGAQDVARARLLLAKDGLPSGGSIGYEIFDRGDAMTSTQFQQEINETRALEGEIARSIRMIQGVRQVRVHLVLPRRQPFSRDTQPAQASVVLTMAGSARLDPQAVQAVLNLVAAAVPGLKPQGISVVDSRGALLARAGQPTGEQQAVETGEEIRRSTELRLSRAVEDMLEESLGQGRVRAEAAVEMTFDNVNERTENFDPNQQVVRSTQTVTDTNKTTEAEKPVSVQNNLPNADAGQGSQTGSQQNRQEETTNYEIGKTVRTLIREQPQIARISLAVMVDGEAPPGANGKPAWHERSPDEIARITRLVQSAIGFDAKRGDKVEVVSMRFATPADDIGTAAPNGPFGLGLEKADLVSLAQSGILAIVVLIALLVVLRPMAVRLTAMPAGLLPSGAMAGAFPGAGGMLAAAGGVGGGGGMLLGEGGDMGAQALLADESMGNAASVEAQMRASAIKRLSDMVDKHPEETLSIMRGWMSADQP